MRKRIPKYSELFKKGIPAVLIPGIIFAAIYGTEIIDKIKNYYQEKRLFPDNGIVLEVEDGDTFSLKSGKK